MILVLLLAVAAVPRPACIAVSGDRIRYSDLAVADARFAAADPALVAGFSPVPGAVHVLLPGELAHLAVKAGLVSVGELFARACFERRLRELGAVEVLAAVAKSWGLDPNEIEVLEQSAFRVPDGEVVFSKASAPSNFARGWVVYDGSQRFPLWARVRVLKQLREVVVTEDIVAGSVIREEQLKIVDRKDSPGVARAASEIAQVTGRVARVRIRVGTPVMLSGLEGPRQVERGAIVKVEVRDGGASLRFDAKAESDGMSGQTIALRNPTSGKVFQARVIGENQVLVIPRGAREAK